MLFNAQTWRTGVPILVSALIITGLYLMFRPVPQQDRIIISENPLVSTRPESDVDPKVIVARGVKALRGRVPRLHIRGMLDRDFDLVDFGRAALKLAPEGNADAEYILGWLCEDGICYRQASPVQTWLSKEVDQRAPILTADQKYAAQWYILSSVHGCAASSVAMGHLLEQYQGDCDHPENNLTLAVRFYERGMAQNDHEARIDFAMCYAWGSGVTAEPQRAWRELQTVIADGDEEMSTYAISQAIHAWKNRALTPPDEFCRGEKQAAVFLKRYDPGMTEKQLNQLYAYTGCTPDANPQFRHDLATKVRKDWLPLARRATD